MCYKLERPLPPSQSHATNYRSILDLSPQHQTKSKQSKTEQNREIQEMVVQSQPSTVTDQFIPLIPTCKLLPLNAQIPIIDLSNPDSKTDLVNACKDFGFFKVVNHGVPFESITLLENEAVNFFSLPLHHKQKAGSPSPFGYGDKQIGRNGDVGWLEYLLLCDSPESVSDLSLNVFPDEPRNFSFAVNNYLLATKKMACLVLEALAEGLNIGQDDVFSKLLKDEKSDSCFRMNHYPPCPSELEALMGDPKGKVVGFGEHTDPQIISVLRSNDISGLEISIGDGDWVSVGPDPNSFFIIVGDSLQVMTNGRFKSVKHRVVVKGDRSRISMIYFGGPPPSEIIAPLPSLLEEGEESLYKEFTWREYKMAAYKSRLADYRLGIFEKTSN